MKLDAALAISYRNKSEEAFIIADSMKHTETKRFMMSVALDYQMLAEMVENLLRDCSVPAEPI